MDSEWTTLRSNTQDILGYVRFRSNGEKFQRRVIKSMGPNISPIPLQEHLDNLKKLSEGLEDVVLEYFNDYDYSRTLVTGWSDDLDGYNEDDFTPCKF